jgi:predicted RNA binding protein YcfA (HicA-like mRNA interferase family)
VGSHAHWTHATGVSITVPDGHRTISPGVYRKITGAIAEAKERTAQDEQED